MTELWYDRMTEDKNNMPPYLQSRGHIKSSYTVPKWLVLKLLAANFSQLTNSFFILVIAPQRYCNMTSFTADIQNGVYMNAASGLVMGQGWGHPFLFLLFTYNVLFLVCPIILASPNFLKRCYVHLCTCSLLTNYIVCTGNYY